MSGPAQNIHNIYDPLWEHDACGIGAVVALQTSCENFSNNLQKRNGA